MGKIVYGQKNDWSLGMTNDYRTKDRRHARLIRGFDAHSFQHKLIPFRNMESGDASANAQSIRNFAIALRTGTTYSLYGFGRISASNDGIKIYYKDLTYGSANDLDDADWAAAANGQGNDSTSPDYNLFVYYRKRGLIYGAVDGTAIFAFSPTGTSFANSHQALTYTSIYQGLVHSKDDILYIPYY